MPTIQMQVPPRHNMTSMTSSWQDPSLQFPASPNRQPVHGNGIIKKIFPSKRYGFVVVKDPVVLGPNCNGDEAHFNFSDLKMVDANEEKKLLLGWELEFCLERQQPGRQSKFCDFKAVYVRPKPAMVMSAKVLEVRGTQVIAFCEDLNRRLRLSKERVNSESFAIGERMLVKVIWEDLPTCDVMDIPAKFASSIKFQNSQSTTAKHLSPLGYRNEAVRAFGHSAQDSGIAHDDSRKSDGSNVPQNQENVSPLSNITNMLRTRSLFGDPLFNPGPDRSLPFWADPWESPSRHHLRDPFSFDPPDVPSPNKDDRSRFLFRRATPPSHAERLHG